MFLRSLFWKTTQKEDIAMTIGEKVSYIKGLMDGLDIDKSTKEGKVLCALTDLLGDMAAEIQDLGEHVDEVDEDLAAVEDIVYEGDDDDYDFDDEYCTGNCDNCDGCDFDEDDGVYEFTCPNCKETVYFDDSIFEDDDEELVCPACGTKIDMASIFEFDDEDEDGDENK
jgi:DNA-directed RNA polymerase subunit RPC12/RpoP